MNDDGWMINQRNILGIFVLTTESSTNLKAQHASHNQTALFAFSLLDSQKIHSMAAVALMPLILLKQYWTIYWVSAKLQIRHTVFCFTYEGISLRQLQQREIAASLHKVKIFVTHVALNIIPR